MVQPPSYDPTYITLSNCHQSLPTGLTYQKKKKKQYAMNNKLAKHDACLQGKRNNFQQHLYTW
jgi:hypothetical protein